MKRYLQVLADHVRQLLNCEQVSLFLYCPASFVRHPLLTLFYQLYQDAPLCSGSLCDPAFLSNEHLWGMCDMALQSGRCITNNLLTGNRSLELPGSITVASIERPAGVMGFLFCRARQENTLLEGERNLLTQYLPILAYQVEQALSAGCSALPEAVERGNSDRETQEQHVFLSLIGHELRAPLMAIKGYTGLLQEYGLGAKDEQMKMSRVQQRDYLDSIMAQIKHLEVLIGDMLDISHIQSGRLTLHCTHVDLAQLCQHVVQLLRNRIELQDPGRYYILCNINAELPAVWADADRVQQILTNLLENALKYSPAGGLIEIHGCVPANCAQDCPCVQAEDSYSSPEKDSIFVCVTVSDQGIGIPSQQQPLLFKPFVRLAHPATRHVGGSGLGLYIARKLVEAMHGRVLLRSREGQGTSITFMLPAIVASDLRVTLAQY